MRPLQASAGPGRLPCGCNHPDEPADLVVLTGGPGAGKTAVLNLARQRMCRHVQVLEESATILFGGGFPRERDPEGRRAGQRAIYHIQRELEGLAISRPQTRLALCDRGALDGLAYWPGDRAEFFAQLGTQLADELARYRAVIHLRTPEEHQYPRDNVLRIESFDEAREIDGRILDVWRNHPDVHVINSDEDFLDKARAALLLIDRYIPECCRRQVRGGPAG